MARRRRYGRRRRQSFKIPILSVAIIAGQGLLAHQYSGGNLAGTLNNLQSFYTGVDLGTGRFNPQMLAIGWLPWFAKGLISKVARPLGARPKVPFGLPFSIS